MSDRDRRVRTAAILALVVFAAVALRGRLPDVTPPERRAPEQSATSLVIFVVVVLLAAAVLVIAIIAMLRAKKDRLRPLGVDDGAERAFSGLRKRILVLGVAAAALVALLAVVPLPFDGPGEATQQEAGDRVADPGGSGRAPDDDSVPPEPDKTQSVVLIISGGVLLTLVLVGAVIAERRRYRPAEPVYDDGEYLLDDERVPGSLERAAELGLAEVDDLTRDPRAAIIACYAAMERGLADAPDAAPLDSDTPTEVLARAVGHGAIRSSAAGDLVRLFTEARFSQHDMTENHRESAAELLRRVLADLRGATWSS